MAKQKQEGKASRTIMSQETSDKWLDRHLKDRGLKGAEAELYVRHHAATRLAALARYAAKHAAPPAKPKKGSKKKAA